MYLRRLDLYGFKSFAQRTTFHFGPGITAIVGPNGSGKSNIADALRWVLGEQSGKLLRAKRLEDIIYAGSGKRQRADRVEVSITLDNSNGWLPLDVSEVTITRRGTRSGDSDYYINGKKTRLRELQTLLMKATASQSSYAIIGQGLVETVLNLRPEERRELIEEAADIARYRLKIEEAEDRLKSTHENVERIRLLVKEIAPRLAQLERQARRAGDHARLSRELMEALRVYYEHQWQRAQEGLTVARAGHDQAQAEFVQARVALETCQRELADISAELEEHRRRAAAAAAERERLEARVRDLERSIAVAGERRGILEARRAELGEELAALHKEVERLEALLSKEDTEEARLRQAAEEARSEVERRRQKLADLENEIREASARVHDAEAKAQRLEAAAADLRNRAQRLADSRREAEKELARLETRRRSLVSQIGEQLSLLRGHRAQEAQIVGAVSATGARRARLEAEVRELRERLAAVDAAQSERRSRLEALRARLAMVEEAQRQVEASRAGSEVSIEGALGTVYEILRVPKGLEEAITAALGDQLEAFIFQHQSEAVAAIQAVISGRGPRTVALPLDSMKQVYPLSVLKEKGVLGVAARLVKYPARYEKLVDALLGRTIVVQDAATALRLVKRGMGTVVTTDGMVFHPMGYVSGGRSGEGKPLMLAYERDLETLPKEIERLEKAVAGAEAEAEGLRGRLDAAERELASLVSEAEAALGRRSGLHDSLSQRQQRLAQLKGELRSVLHEYTALQERDRATAAEIERLGREREAVLAEAKECRENAKHLERANAVLGERRAALERELDEAAQALARADAEFRSLAVQRESAQAALARLRSQAEAKARQERALGEELEALAIAAARQEEELAAARQELSRFIEGTPSPEGAHHLEARQRDLHSQVLSSQTRMFEAERRVLEAEAEVRRWELEIEALRARMSEDGMTLSPSGEVLTPEAVQIAIPFWLTAEQGGDQDRPRPISGGAAVDPEALAREIESLRGQLRALGPVNVEALGDYEAMKERHDFLTGQLEDLALAEESLRRAVEELTKLMKRRFEATFEQVARSFEENFHAFFGPGGHARLSLTDPKDPMAGGVEIEARPPGKRTRSLTQLSGGEKALTSLSLLFALLQANPAPFCVLDEVDAMLDEANVARFANALKELSARTQFIVITHNRRTIEIADSIYGVSMTQDAVSRVLSMRIGDVVSPN